MSERYIGKRVVNEGLVYWEVYDTETKSIIAAEDVAGMLNRLASLEAVAAAVDTLKLALEQYADPTNWTSEATYTYEIPFSENSDGNPQEREATVELGVSIVWAGDFKNSAREIAAQALDQLAALDALAPGAEAKDER